MIITSFLLGYGGSILACLLSEFDNTGDNIHSGLIINGFIKIDERIEKNLNNLIETEEGWKNLWRMMSRESCYKNKEEEREIEEVDKQFILKGLENVFILTLIFNNLLVFFRIVEEY